ncbi:hypothetical protein NPIL_661371 [Nephila pilipes]|uniref:Uncharacterized protein n=1 Tax=Nephila pilipes TaxID=299642 RepID=A0A8X6U8M9_NEPPI|nr:hypothetical protein NPIL_661371 [Nephila pilipes]
MSFAAALAVYQRRAFCGIALSGSPYINALTAAAALTRCAFQRCDRRQQQQQRSAPVAPAAPFQRQQPDPTAARLAATNTLCRRPLARRAGSNALTTCRRHIAPFAPPPASSARILFK